ncbi:MAG: right-handed parallel beta-helix repeat-containing protein [Lautropia sp.]|nr:right-handed parallel beta-helix repeat-containing protein [Lautropia sp.]
MRRTFLKYAGVGCSSWLWRPWQASAASGCPDGRTQLDPRQFGAVADGVSDDTVACIAAARAAARQGGWLVFSHGTYLIRGQIEIAGAIAGVLGLGGRIILSNDDDRAGFLIRNLQGAHPVTRPVWIAHLDIDSQVFYRDQAAVFYGIDVQGVCFVENRIRNIRIGRAIYLRSMLSEDVAPGAPVPAQAEGHRGAGRRASCRSLVRHMAAQPDVDELLAMVCASGPLRGVMCNVVAGNQIEMATADRGIGIEIEAERTYPSGEHAPMQTWLKNFMVAGIPVPARGNVVVGNRVTGGYYGLSLSGAGWGLVQGNHLQGQMRSMSVQDSSCANIIVDNQAIDSESSSIHLAYGSSDNVIAYNEIRTARAHGEGLLQAYVGCSRNSFHENTVTVEAGALPRYLAYTGVAANENSFWCNHFTGQAERACVAVESAFNSRDPRRSHRGYGQPYGRVDHFTNRGMYGVRIVGNTMHLSGDTPVITLAQVSDAAGDYPLLMCEVAGNTVHWSGLGVGLELAEGRAGMLREVVFSGNVFAPALTATQQVLPRGHRHFVEAIDRRRVMPPSDGV